MAASVGRRRAVAPTTGLSPPTRGIPVAVVDGFGGLRSIPAYAGDPYAAAVSKPADGVYPRLRGGSRLSKEAR